MVLTIKPEDHRDPYDSHQTLCRTENANDCDGVVCGTAVTDEQGNTFSALRHDHLVVSGYNPLASPIYFVVGK